VIATADVESFPHSFNIRADFAIKLLVFWIWRLSIFKVLSFRIFQKGIFEDLHVALVFIGKIILVGDFSLAKKSGGVDTWNSVPCSCFFLFHWNWNSQRLGFRSFGCNHYTIFTIWLEKLVSINLRKKKKLILCGIYVILCQKLVPINLIVGGFLFLF
jgi:hypothetical protein